MVNDEAKQSVIQFEDVSFEYPGAETESIQHINLDVKEGEFLVLTGGSGCGKTTLTRLINGLAEQFYEGTLKGRVTLLGRSISEYPLYEIGKKVGIAVDSPYRIKCAIGEPFFDVILRAGIATEDTRPCRSPVLIDHIGTVALSGYTDR